MKKDWKSVDIHIDGKKINYAKKISILNPNVMASLIDFSNVNIFEKIKSVKEWKIVSQNITAIEIHIHPIHFQTFMNNIYSLRLYSPAELDNLLIHGMKIVLNKEIEMHTFKLM